MLDVFLEVASSMDKQAAARTNTLQLLNQLPDEVLQKIASGQLLKSAYDDGCWLDKFRGTPLLDQAIALEREELEIQMEDNSRRQQERALREQFGGWDETQAKRDDLSIKRKMLELELAGGGSGAPEMGGQEGEDMVPPGAAEEPEPEKGPGARLLNEADLQGAPEPLAAGGPEGPPGEGPPPAEKPKPKPPTTKVTKETTEKPVPEKVDIKTAAAVMRMTLLAPALRKEAQPADGSASFRRAASR